MSGEKTESRGVMRSLARRLVRFYYPRLEISGAEKIPQQGPVLLCANHSNSMVDPVLIGVTASRPVRFIAKATLFDMPVLGRAMHALGMVPAYRAMDDASQVRRNLETLDTGAQLLVEGKALGIFPEGKSTDKARLDKVRSGAARMAIKAYDEGTRGIKVVPLGVNYERKEQFRSAVWIRVGDPIDLDEWVERNDGDSRKAMRSLTGEIAGKLKELMVHLDEPEWEPWLEDLEKLIPSVVDTAEVAAGSLQQRKRIADAMNHFLAKDREQAEEVAGEIESYRRTVKSAGLKVGSPVLEQSGIPAALKVCSLVLKLLAFSLPALLGSLWHLLPFLAVRFIAKMLDQPGMVTKSTHRIGVGLPLYLSWYAALAWLMLDMAFMPSVVVSTLVFMPFAGIFALQFWRRASAGVVVLWHQWKLSCQRRKLKELRQLRAGIQSRLGDLAAQYAEVVPRPEPTAKMLWSRKATILSLALSSLLLVSLAVLLVGFWIIQPRGILSQKALEESLPLTELLQTQAGRASLSRRLAVDEAKLLRFTENMKDLEEEALEVKKDKVAYEEANPGENWFVVQENSDKAQVLLRSFYKYREQLFFLLWKYREVEKPAADPLQLRAFLVEYAAGVVLFQCSLNFVHGFDEPSIVAKLNEPIKKWGIPPGFYNFIRKGLDTTENMALFQAFNAEYKALQANPELVAVLESLPVYGQLKDVISQGETAISRHSAGRTIQAARRVRDGIRDTSGEVVYEVQKVISSWIGDFRPMKVAPSIDVESREFGELRAALRPGDIILERRNYYGSNAFLPGYWPHAALYIGTPEELQELGLDEDILSEGFGEDQDKVERFWGDPAMQGEGYTSPDLHHGDRHVIIEAVSEGVIFSSLEHSIGGADSVAVLRPMVDRQEVIRAVKTAFSHWGKPYDFEFDFSSVDKLVCTEVVYRCYGGNSPGRPVSFPVEEIMGRTTMPAGNLVRKFKDESAAGKPQLEFIRFLEPPVKKIYFKFKALFVVSAFGAFMMALLVCHLGVKTLKMRLFFILLLLVFVIPAFNFYRNIDKGDGVNSGRAVFKDEDQFIRTLELKGLTWWNYYEHWSLGKDSQGQGEGR